MPAFLSVNAAEIAQNLLKQCLIFLLFKCSAEVIRASGMNRGRAWEFCLQARPLMKAIIQQHSFRVFILLIFFFEHLILEHTRIEGL